MSLESLPPLREVIERYGLWAQKKLGQNFILDLNLTRKIARTAAITPVDTVIEVGPGPGGLTRALLESPAKAIIVIEKDRRCLPALEELKAKDGRLTVIEGDALEIAIPGLCAAPRKIVANLPYNIATVLLTRWLGEFGDFYDVKENKLDKTGIKGNNQALTELLRNSTLPKGRVKIDSPPPGEGLGEGFGRERVIISPDFLRNEEKTQVFSPYASLTLMFQKEVAERFTAGPNSKAYGRLSVLTQWLCDIELAFDLPPQAFVPAPKVTSTVVHLTPRAKPLFPADKEKLEAVVKAAFGQRRKMLRQSLKTLLPNPAELLESAGIDGTRRAESLSIEEFCRLAENYKDSTS